MFSNRFRTIAIGAFAVVASAVVLNAAGLFPGFPIVGQGSYCSTNVTAGVPGTAAVCGGATVPAGPTALTGSELVPMDTQLAQGAQPQTVTATTATLAAFGSGSSDPKNLIRNGDISVNPFQRGTSQAADITTVALYGPDGFFFKSGTGTAINWSKQTGASDISATNFTASLRFQRKSGQTGVIASCQYSILTSTESIAIIGQPFVYSFWALTGANFSAANSTATVTVAYGTGSDGTAANFTTGAWTGQTNAVSSAVTLTSTWAQYQVAGSIPSTARQVGVSICFTPVGTAGTNDWIETANHQLEVVKTASVVYPSSFEHQTSVGAFIRAARNYWVINEPAATVAVMNGQATTTTVAKYVVQFPVPMRTAPTSTVTTGTFAASKSDGTAASTCTATATSASNTATVGGITATCAAMSFTAGNASQLFGAAGTGTLEFSAEL